MLNTGSNPTDVINIKFENTSWLPVSADDKEVSVVAVIVRWLIMRLMWYVVKPLYRQHHRHHHHSVTIVHVGNNKTAVWYVSSRQTIVIIIIVR